MMHEVTFCAKYSRLCALSFGVIASVNVPDGSFLPVAAGTREGTLERHYLVLLKGQWCIIG